MHKLDLTVNFIDLDELEASIEHLISLERLNDLYMMGNPCQANWDGFADYVIAKLPQLQTLDGKEITRSMRIIASQKLPILQVGCLFLPSNNMPLVIMATKNIFLSCRNNSDRLP